jgi:hypothetical protein
MGKPMTDHIAAFLLGSLLVQIIVGIPFAYFMEWLDKPR